MKEKKDNIYIYLWEEFNTVYIGRTINPKSRHYTHKHRETEKTYQFSSEHHVEHPKMIIIEGDLTIEEGIEREKYWINYYRENTPYEVLNKKDGGQKGRHTPNNLTEEEKKELKKEYYQRNKERILEYAKEYNKLHKEKNKAHSKKYYNNHKKEKKIYREKYYEERKVELSEKKKMYYNEHKEKIKEKIKEYYQKNKIKMDEYRKEYYQKNKERLNEKRKMYYDKHKENTSF